jgi:hypothetical protein
VSPARASSTATSKSSRMRRACRAWVPSRSASRACRTRSTT